MAAASHGSESIKTMENILFQPWLHICPNSCQPVPATVKPAVNRALTQIPSKYPADLDKSDDSCRPGNLPLA